MTMPTPTRRRWFQFRLRTLLIVVAVVAVPLAWIAKERRQSVNERQIFAQLLSQDQSADAVFAGSYDLWNDYTLGRSQGYLRDVARMALGERVLAFWTPDSNDLSLVAEFTNLQKLEARSKKLRYLTPLIGQTKLLDLYLSDTGVDDLSPLSGLLNLRWLFFEKTEVSDLTPIAGLKQLTALRIDGTRVRDLSPLYGLSNLQLVSLHNSIVSITEIDALQKALLNCRIDLGDRPHSSLVYRTDRDPDGSHLRRARELFPEATIWGSPFGRAQLPSGVQPFDVNRLRQY
jgi:hypothetical protein